MISLTLHLLLLFQKIIPGKIKDANNIIVPFKTFENLFKINIRLALANFTQWLDYQPAEWRVVGLTPVKARYFGVAGSS